ncbi:MAG: CHAT domain-containing protein [Rhodobacteraceae bacterium]|nr:CHAT domain-containing protein [Paracoccaceae bacterium]
MLNQLQGEHRSATQAVLGAKARLAHVLLAPLGKISKDRSIAVAPDGALHRLNFALLTPGGRGHLFVTNELRLLAHGRVIAVGIPTPPPNAKNQFFVPGGRAYGEPLDPETSCEHILPSGKFCPLPFAEKEARAIASLAQGRALTVEGAYTGAEATEAVVKTRSPGSRIVHLATHGGYTPGAGTGGSTGCSGTGTSVPVLPWRGYQTPLRILLAVKRSNTSPRRWPL